jgi:hypothetical protein
MVVKAGTSKIDDAPGDATKTLGEPLDGCTGSLNSGGGEVRVVALLKAMSRAWGVIAEYVLFRVGPPVIMVVVVVVARCRSFHFVVGVHVGHT